MMAPAKPLGLYYGRSRAPLVLAVPDLSYPGLWRMAWPNGELSDIANLSRIKDAAVAICERGRPPRNRRRFLWKIERSKTALEAPRMRWRERAAA
jgi:hypothetical protein